VAEVGPVPSRSPAQFVVKTTIKRLARVAAGRDYPTGSAIRTAFDAIRDDNPLTPAAMLATHVVGAQPAISTRPETPFIADIVLRHTPVAPSDPLPLVLSAVERLVRRASAAPAGAGKA
jgi:hypothetical protein